MPTLTQTPGTLRPLLRLVWPVLVEQTLTMMIGLSDTLLAGKYLERQHLTAMANLSYLMWAFMTLFAVVSVGAMAMTARFVGAGDFRAANRVVNQSFVSGAVPAITLAQVRSTPAPHPGLGHLAIGFVHVVRLVHPFRFEVFNRPWPGGAFAREVLIVLGLSIAHLVVAWRTRPADRKAALRQVFPARWGYCVRDPALVHSMRGF